MKWQFLFFFFPFPASSQSDRNICYQPPFCCDKSHFFFPRCSSPGAWLCSSSPSLSSTSMWPYSSVCSSISLVLWTLSSTNPSIFTMDHISLPSGNHFSLRDPIISSLQCNHPDLINIVCCQGGRILRHFPNHSAPRPMGSSSCGYSSQVKEGDFIDPFHPKRGLLWSNNSHGLMIKDRVRIVPDVRDSPSDWPPR